MKNKGDVFMDRGKPRYVKIGKSFAMEENQQIDRNAKSKECKIRIYGNSLGTTKDIINFWSAIEKNYISILAYENLIKMFSDSREIIDSVAQSSSIIRVRGYRGNEKEAFMQHFEKYNISDIVSPDDFPLIIKISFNSPGWWEVIGQWNIFKQIREYLKERHLRVKDKEFGWEMEKQFAFTEIEEKQLSNDLLKLDITQKMIDQLRDIGLSDVEIRHVVQKSYGDLYLLDKHIDKGQIVDIKIVDE